MLFLAHILNRPVYDNAGIRLGSVEDLVLSGLDLFPRVAAVVLARHGRRAVFIQWEEVGQVDRQGVRLAVSRAQLHTAPLDDDALFLRRDILDKQIVDIHGRKVVRVNDLQLAPIDGELRLIGADIGVAGLLRRLSLERPVRALAGAARRPLPERVIPWNYVEGLETEWTSVRLNVSHRRLRELPAPDIADILEQLHPADREELLLHFDDETIADTLPHLEDEVQADVIMAMSDERASDIMEIMEPDDAADVLGELSEERAERILHLMEPEEAEDVRELLQYDEDSAGGIMTPEFLAIQEGITADAALAQIRKQAPDAETIYYLYVTDAAGCLEGVLSLRDLITAPSDTPIVELVHREVIRVRVDDDQETVANQLTHYHLLAIPVVDADGVLRGIVTVDDVLDVLEEEADEDISRAAGAIEESDESATPLQQVLLRLPWLAGAGAAGVLIALFLLVELGGTHAALAPLIALVPLLLLPGVQIGGQGAATTQVGLSNGEDPEEILRQLARAHWPSGILLMLCAALAGGLFAAALGQPAHALAVGGVILGVMLTEMAVGSLLPLLLHRLRWDPVLVSRPALAVLALLLGVPLLVQVL